ncbi:mediator of RNA polymerase II transcription subunit 29 [Caerostris darwini]|uniref:Mediator of RNA polymerase II transcription subunit 29 n=1 Tax=Caerostris darwini TaxID=1538125 RepID=A0AAV4QBX7_9ARAC|nr:mediator of RNA polymerase II transcription subunit 29 [Caerostris darwini]
MMSAPIGQIGPPMHTQMPQQQPPPPPQPGRSQQDLENKYDNVNRVKNLIWALKHSYINVMKVAGAKINHMAAGKTTEEPPPRLNKTLDDFFAVCNQIESSLKAIQDCTMQHKNSIQYLPLHVTLGKQDPSSGPSQDGNLSYTQYVSAVKSQVNFIKSVQEILLEGVRNVSKSDGN